MERAASIAEHLATSAESPSALATGLCGRTLSLALNPSGRSR